MKLFRIVNSYGYSIEDRTRGGIFEEEYHADKCMDSLAVMHPKEKFKKEEIYFKTAKMLIENVILKTHDFNQAKLKKEANEEKTGNMTFIINLGPNNNSHPTIYYQDYLVIEIVKFED